MQNRYKGRRKGHKLKRRGDIITWRKVLTAEEQQKLFDYLETNATDAIGRRNRVIFELLYQIGLRAEELINLKVQHTPWILGVNEVEIYRGKNDKDRSLPVSDRMAEMLNKHIREDRRELVKRRRSDISRQVFFSGKNNPLSYSGLYYIVNTVAKQAGIEKNVTPHTMRHTCATWALMSKDIGGAGLDILEVMQLMGHTSISVTEVYAHFVRNMNRALGKRLDRLNRTVFQGREQLVFAYN